MSLFNIDEQNHLSLIQEKDLKKESVLQKITEKNLNQILGLQFVRSEFNLQNFRLDTLAFDNETSAFVIIEFKRDKNFSVIDQGYAYLSLMLNNKADFILEYNDNNKIALKREDIDWSQSKVLFISPSFTQYQKEAINFKDLPIELWEVKFYTNKTVSFQRIQKVGSKESIKTISKHNDTIEKVSREIKVYTEQEHLELGSDDTIDLYERFKTAILQMDEVVMQPKKKYIAFIGTKNIVDFRLQRSTLKLWINLKKGELDDPKKITRDVSNIGHWGNGDYELQCKTDDNFEYVLSLIRQSIDLNKK